MKNIYKVLLENVAQENVKKDVAIQVISMLKQLESEKIEDIAIVGMSVKYPKGTENIEDFWQIIKTQANCNGELPATRQEDLEDILAFKGIKDAQYLKGSYLEEIDKFDYKFFNITPLEAKQLDPNQRLFLENIYNTIEDAGYINKINNSKTGVFLGFANELRETYVDWIKETDKEKLSLSAVGNLSSIIPARISFFKNLRGPALVVDTACSSSLVAVHLACNAIKNGDCTQAIVGGIRVNLLPLTTNATIGIESSDGNTKAFDDNSDGTGNGEGVAAIFIKPLKAALKDKDHIYAVIKGSAVNQDGASAGITAPNVQAQTEVILSAWKNAGINPETISYIEAHGTGTRLGDPIEVEALTNAFNKFTHKKQFCAIGTIKANVGHLYEAAGITGLIKAALCLKNKQLPGLANFKYPNKEISFENSPLYVNDHLTEWETEQGVRRCGVSAFGFSGTNCHIVLEEAPLCEVAEEETNGGIFVISAKSKNSLNMLIDRYIAFLERTNSTLNDIYANAAIHREHFGYRVAILAEDKIALYNKLQWLKKNKLTGNNIDVFCAYHQVAYRGKKIIGEDEITWEIHQELMQQAQEIIDSSKDKAALAKLYIQGADIKWEQYYSSNYNRVYIPLYAFEKEHCWLTINQEAQKSNDNVPQEIIHPLIETLKVESINEDIYNTQFAVEKHFVLKDHVILDNNVIPGTTYVEMFNEVGRLYFDEAPLEITDLTFIKPIAVAKENVKDVQTVVKKENGFLELSIVSKNEYDQWDIHAVGKVSPTNAAKEHMEIHDLVEELNKEEYAINQSELIKGFIDFGPRWLNYKKLYKTNQYAIGELCLNNAFADDLRVYRLHPSLLDMAVNVVSLVLGKRYLPLSYEKIDVYGPTPSKFYSYVAFDQEQLKGETISFDIKLLDAAGNVFVKIKNYVLKRVREFNKMIHNNYSYSQKKWLVQEMAEKQYSLQGNNVLIVYDDEAQFLSLKERLEIEKTHVVGLKGLDNQKLVESLKEFAFNDIVYLMDQKCVQLDVLREESALINKPLVNLFDLSKAIGATQQRYPMNMYVVGWNGDKVTTSQTTINPICNAIYAMSKVISKEYGNLNVKAIDLDETFNLDEVVYEMKCKDNIPVIAYREAKRYVEYIERLNIEEIPVREFEIKEAGTYIITGGTGGIGLKLAEYIAKRNKANIVLLSRKGMQDAIKPAISKIEALGATITCLSCNIAHKEELEQSIQEVRRRFGHINGVFHAAGNAGDGFIAHKDVAAFEQVIDPKIKGTILIDALTGQDELDFIVLFSSVASIMALPGQSDYTAANSFLDAFATCRENVIAINWPAWNDVGMAVKHKADFDTLFKTINSENAINQMEQLAQRQISNAIVGIWNYNADIYTHTNLYLSNEILNNLRKQKAQREYKKQKQVKAVEAVVLTGRADSNYTALEKEIGQLWGEVLGYYTLNIYEDFYSLGGDSILAVRLINRMNEVLGLTINVTDMFNYITINEFAAHIQEIRDAGENVVTEHIIKHQEKKPYYPVTPAQEGIYLTIQLEPDSKAYNLPLVMNISGNVNVAKLESTFKKLIERHEAFRTAFKIIDGQLVQKVNNHVDFELEQVQCVMEELDATIENLIRPFDLSVAPLLRGTLIKTNEEEYYLFMDLHHIIADGYAMSILLQDFIAIYNDIAQEPITVQYTDYTIWEEERYAQGKIQEQEKYWLDKYNKLPEALNLTTDYVRPSIKTTAGDFISIEIDKSLSECIKRSATMNQTTNFNVLLTGIYILLHKYSRQDDIVVGTAISGRLDKSLENVVGMFMNMLPLRMGVNRKKSFTELLQDVKGEVLEGIKNQEYPFEKLVDNLHLERDASRNTLFDVCFILQNINKDFEITDVGIPKFELELGDMKLKSYGFNKYTAKYDIAFEVVESNDGFKLNIEYSTALFKKETINYMAQHYINILREIVQFADKKIAEIDMLSSDEKNKLINDFKGEEFIFDQNKLIYQMIEESAQISPDKVALIDENEEVTYRQLNERANQFARYLEAQGVQKDDLVAILMTRSVEMAISILAIWKLGAAYIPMDINYPKTRIEGILEDAEVKKLISYSMYVEKLSSEYQLLTVNLDQVEEAVLSYDKENLNRASDKDALAYVIYTSGSTGKPKGAMVEQIGMLNHMYAKINEAQMNEETIIVQNASHCFDISVWQFFAALATGGQVIIYSNEVAMNPKEIIEKTKGYKVTILEVVPSLLGVMVEYLEESYVELPDLQYLFVTGETLKAMLAKKWFKLYPSIPIVNAYGPTEASDDITHYVIKEEPQDMSIPIGKALHNFNIYIVDEAMNLCPVGVKGEICVSGIGVGRGYLKDKKKTEAVFCTDPFIKEREVRLYKTGDLGCWMPDGNIQFFGRKDYQVKIRGFRIELEEIESSLINYPDVSSTVVVDLEKENGEKYLCAYVVAQKKLDMADVKRYLLERLPSYMVPAYMVQIDDMPLSSNGKVDRKALPSVDIQMEASTTYRAPSTELEIKLASIWQEILKVETIGVDDNFFEIGGNSLSIMMLSNRIHKELDVEIPLGQIFNLATISELASYISSAEKTQLDEIKPTLKQDFYPVSSAQKRLLLLNEIEPEDLSWNNVMACDIRGHFDEDKFNKIFETLFERHESLRTRFEKRDNEFVQVVEEQVACNIETVICEEEEIQTILGNAVRQFNLYQAPLMRVMLIKVKGQQDRCILVLDAHHTIADGISLVILMKEFGELYNGEALEPIRLNYRDYTIWQQQERTNQKLQAQEKYWLDMYQGEVPVLELPVDYNREAVRSIKGAWESFRIDKELTKKLYAFNKETNTTTFMVLMAAYNILLNKYSHQEDVVVGVPSSGRNYADLDNVIGMFVNILAMRNHPVGSKTALEFIEEVKDSSIEAYKNQDYPYEDLVANVKIKRELGRNPLVETLFSMEFETKLDKQLDDIQINQFRVESGTTTFDISLYATEENEEILMEFEYSSGLFKQSTIERMCRSYITILEDVLANPNKLITDIEVLSPEERYQVTQEFNDNRFEFDEEKLIYQRIEESAEKYADKVAIIYEDEYVTYSALNERANQLALYLKENGVCADDTVGLLMPRSPQLIISAIALWKIGAGYIPIDVKYPVKRIETILEDSKARKLISYTQYVEDLGEELQSIVVNLDREQEIIATYEKVNLNLPIKNSYIAYVIYTSGSTGKPKGAMVEQLGMLNHMLSKARMVDYSSDTIVVQNASHCFDVSVWQLFMALSIGGQVVIYSNDVAMDPKEVIERTRKHKVNMLEVVPSFLGVMMDYLEINPVQFPDLKYLFVTGETLKYAVAKKWFSLYNDIKVVNAYGPTEAADDITIHIMDTLPPDNISIGKPIQNLNIYIVDDAMHLCPIGVKGEICVSGIGVGRGYINDKEKTAKAFFTDPFIKDRNVRLYKTGDLGAWMPDGNIQFFGRKDYQVKIRGFRIELEEIEDSLNNYPSIKQAVVIDRENAKGEKYLCGYFVGSKEVNLQELKEHLLQTLPNYMIPAYMVQLETLPLTPNGKVDRKSLPDVNYEIEEKTYVEPTNELEAKLVDVWKEILLLDKVGITDDFFEIGGHSLNASILVGRIYKVFNVKMQLKELFRLTTIKDLAQYISSAMVSTYEQIPAYEKREFYPLSSAQQRIFIAHNMITNSKSYNVAEATMIEGALDVEKLKRAINTIVERHDSIRTSFEYVKGEVMQHVHYDMNVEVEYEEIGKEEDIPKVLEAFNQPFQLDQAPLLKTKLLRINEHKHILVFNMHHIISDGVSLKNLIQEFISVYSNEELEPLRIQYGDYALWQRELLESDKIKEQETYWLSQFEGELPKLNLPKDFDKENELGKGDRIKWNIDADLTNQLQKFAKENGSTLYMVLLAAYNILLEKYTGQEDIVIGTPISGRIHADLEPLIGVFINSLPIRNFPNGQKSFAEFLQEVKEQSIEAFEHQEYPLEQLTSKLKLSGLQESGLFSTMFVLENLDLPQITIGNLKFTGYPMLEETSKFDIELIVAEQLDGLSFTLEYATRFFKKVTIEQMSQDYMKILSKVMAQKDILIADIHLVEEQVLDTVAQELSALEDALDFDF